MALQEFKINGKLYQIITPNKAYEPSHRQAFSRVLLANYGRHISGEFVVKALLEGYDFFTKEFSKVLSEVHNLMFYFFVFNLHEQTAELSYMRSVDGIEIPIEQTYFAQYRRILKLILQESCSIPITENFHPSTKWMERSVGIIEELIFLGEFAFDMVNLVSEQKMTGESIQITFDNDLYVFGNPPEWKDFFELFYDNFNDQIEGSVHDKSLQEKFDKVLKDEFQIDLTELSIIIDSVSQRLYNQIPPRICMFSELLGLFKDESQSPYIENFVMGLTLNQDNVAKLKSGIYSSYNGDRLIHRPFLFIVIENTPCVLFSKYTFLEAVNTLFQNQITHGKLPAEWKAVPFIKNVQKELVQYHKDILENPVESLLQENQVLYERNVRTLKAINHFENLSFNDNPGEIDFIFLLDNTVYLTDCKNLTKRYEMHGYYQDLDKFEPYNKKMTEKLKFMHDNLEKLEQHLRIVLNNPALDINELNIEGIFIVNTPTLYVVNAPFKVYSFYNFELLITGEDVFDGVIVVPDDDETEISWPYIDNYKNYLQQKEQA